MVPVVAHYKDAALRDRQREADRGIARLQHRFIDIRLLQRLPVDDHRADAGGVVGDVHRLPLGRDDPLDDGLILEPRDLGHDDISIFHIPVQHIGKHGDIVPV